MIERIVREHHLATPGDRIKNILRMSDLKLLLAEHEAPR